jgi:hypothetical protein
VSEHGVSTGGVTMNKLELSYSYHDTPGRDGHTYRNISYQFLVDGIPFYRCLDVYQLVKTTKSAGEFFITTCTCGVPECANINFGILVEHVGNFIRWKVPNPTYQDPESDYGDEPESYDEYVFDRDAYIKSIRDALNQLKGYITSFDGDMIAFGMEEGPRADRILELES